MNQLLIKTIKSAKPIPYSEANKLLEKQTITHSINTINWKDFQYKPNVKFRIAHTENEIWLKYYVFEKNIRALEINTNGEVYKDSCVEFFVSLDNKNYYNFEFNCIGTVHLAHGKNRENRTFISPEIIDRISIFSSLGNQPFEEKQGNFEWEMMIKIPIDCFTYDKLKSFSELKAKANFYKCGDNTSEPHYVTWNAINTNTPDYHRPEFFGKIQFE